MKTLRGVLLPEHADLDGRPGSPRAERDRRFPPGFRRTHKAKERGNSRQFLMKTTLGP